MSYEQQPATDDFEDDDDDSALAFVDRSAHVAQRMRKRKFLKWCIVAVPLLLGLILGLAMKAASDKNQSHRIGGGAHVGLPDPPADLATKCHPTAVSTPEGKQACRMLCEPAECCEFPSNLPLSCLAGNEDTCHVYHQYCQVTVKGVTTDPPADMPVAPKDLAQVCSATAIATVDGFTKCQEHCARASCCFETDEAVCQVDACRDYAPCLTIGATNYVNDAILGTISELCRPDQLMTLEGRSGCRTGCSHALCCFTKQGCPHKDTSFCDLYAMCDDLENNLNAISSAEEIKAECTSSKSSYTHMALCEVECERGACCFLPQGCGDIFPDNDCTIYEPCAFMYDGQTGTTTITSTTTTPTNPPTTTSTTTVTTPAVLKVDVDEACKDFDPAAKNAADAECTKYCKDAKCCFDASIDCPDDTSCHVLSACNVLYGEFPTTITIDATVVLEACDAVEISKTLPGQPSLCETVCDGGICCFDEDLDCVVKHDCAMFAPCKILFGDATTTTTTTDSAAVAAVKAACVKDGMSPPSDDAGFAACQTTCEPGACCFTHEGCSDTTLECKAYIPCTYFFSDGNGATLEQHDGDNLRKAGPTSSSHAFYSAEDISAACTSGVSSMCDTMCQSGACCLDSSMECPAGLICDHYASCPGAQRRRVLDMEDRRHLGGKDLRDMLTEVCIEDAADDDNVLGACKALCKKGSCCFAQSHCDAPTGLQCEDYLPCFILYDPTDDDDVMVELEEEAAEDFEEAEELEVEEEEEEEIQYGGHATIFHDSLTYEKVHTACTDHESIHLPGMPSMCQQYCSQALCCFGEHQNCPEDMDCSIFVPCASSSTFDIPMAGSITPPTTTTAAVAGTPPIFSKDVMAKLKVDEACDGSDMSHCVRKCVEAACCYALTEAETCQETSPDLNCDIYSSCDSVYGGGRQGDDGDEEENGRRRR